MPFFTTGELEKRANSRHRYASDAAKARFDFEFKTYKDSDKFDIFLSHRFMDYLLLESLKDQLEANLKLSVYVDHKVDANLNREKVDKETAALLRKRMKQCRCLLFATTENSSESKWMPWELGYFDGAVGRVAILPVLSKDSTGDKYVGSEYLGLYPYIAKGESNGKLHVWVHETENKYTSLSKWINGGAFTSIGELLKSVIR
jgi:hypothetical protein